MYLIVYMNWLPCLRFVYLGDGRAEVFRFSKPFLINKDHGGGDLNRGHQWSFSMQAFVLKAPIPFSNTSSPSSSTSSSSSSASASASLASSASSPPSVTEHDSLIEIHTTFELLASLHMPSGSLVEIMNSRTHQTCVAKILVLADSHKQQHSSHSTHSSDQKKRYGHSESSPFVLVSPAMAFNLGLEPPILSASSTTAIAAGTSDSSNAALSFGSVVIRNFSARTWLSGSHNLNPSMHLSASFPTAEKVTLARVASPAFPIASDDHYLALKAFFSVPRLVQASQIIAVPLVSGDTGTSKSAMPLSLSSPLTLPASLYKGASAGPDADAAAAGLQADVNATARMIDEVVSLVEGDWTSQHKLHQQPCMRATSSGVGVNSDCGSSRGQDISVVEEGEGGDDDDAFAARLRLRLRERGSILMNSSQSSCITSSSSSPSCFVYFSITHSSLSSSPASSSSYFIIDKTSTELALQGSIQSRIPSYLDSFMSHPAFRSSAQAHSTSTSTPISTAVSPAPTTPALSQASPSASSSLACQQAGVQGSSHATDARAVINQSLTVPAALKEPFLSLISILQPCFHPAAARARSLSKLSASVFLHGPRRSKKRMLVAECAKWFGVHLMERSMYTVLGSDEKGTEKKIEELFTAAAKHAPCILHIRRMGAVQELTGVLQKQESLGINSTFKRCIDEYSSRKGHARQTHRKNNGCGPVLLVVSSQNKDDLSPSLRTVLSHTLSLGFPETHARKSIVQSSMMHVPIQCPEATPPSIEEKTDVTGNSSDGNSNNNSQRADAGAKAGTDADAVLISSQLGALKQARLDLVKKFSEKIAGRCVGLSIGQIENIIVAAGQFATQR